MKPGPEDLGRCSGVVGVTLAVLLSGCAIGGPGRRGLEVGAGTKAARARRVPGAVYFVLVDRFANGDPANDGAKVDPNRATAWHGGDVAGLIEHLPWLEALGVETVWTSPLTLGRRAPFMGHGAYHGYWMIDPRRPDVHLGTFEEIRALRDALHARGMKLVLDAVLNHVAYEAPLTREHPQWFHHRGAIKDWDDPLQRVEGDVHGLPDLAVEKDEVFAYLVAALERWIEKVRPDGLRLDAVKHLPQAFWKKLSARLHARHGPGFTLLGEDLEGDPRKLSRRWAATGFDSVFDFPLRYALVDVACKGAPASRLASLLSLDRLYAHPERLTTLLDNHDLPRIRTTCGGDLGRTRLALSLLYLLRGTPALLYGTEVGLEGEHEAEVRADMRFDAEHPLRAFITRLAKTRAAHPALARGQTRILALGETRLALLRVAPAQAGAEAEAVVVVVNLGAAPLAYDPHDDDDALPSLPLTVPARTAMMAPLPLDAEALARLQLRFETGGSLERPGMRRVTFEASVPGASADETILLCGSDPAFGGWDPARAPAFERVAPGRYRLTLRLPDRAVIAWKLVRRSGETLRWQEGDNRLLHLRGASEAGASRSNEAPPSIAW